MTARSDADALRLVQEVLGPTLTELLAGDVPGAAAASGAPPVGVMGPIRDTASVIELLLAAGWSPDLVRAWMIGSNPELEDLAPVEALATGRGTHVLVVAASDAEE